jgi:hypothetical protein
VGVAAAAGRLQSHRAVSGLWTPRRIDVAEVEEEEEEEEERGD